MDRPDSTRNTRDFPEISPMVFWEPTKNTITQEKISTTTVRKAVATSESVFRMPHLASTAVIPAKKAERTATPIHISDSSF